MYCSTFHELVAMQLLRYVTHLNIWYVNKLIFILFYEKIICTK